MYPWVYYLVNSTEVLNFKYTPVVRVLHLPPMILVTNILHAFNFVLLHINNFFVIIE